MSKKQKILPPVLMLAGVVPVMISLRVVQAAPPLWGVILTIAMLILWVVVFILLLQTKLDDIRFNRQLILRTYLLLLPISAMIAIEFVLAKAYILQPLGLDLPSTFILGVFILLLIFIPFGTLWRRKQQWGFLQMADEQKQAIEEFKQTIRTMPNGWGMIPEESINRGHFLFLFGVFFGGGTSILLGVAAIHIGFNGWSPLRNVI